MKVSELLLEREKIAQPSAQDAKAAADTVARDASTYLKKMGTNILNPNAHLFRGNFGRDAKRQWFEHTSPRTDRRPRDMPEPIHDFLDQWFEEHFGFRYRSAGVFVTKNEQQAASYGTAVYFIFPTDPYKILYGSKVDDIWRHVHKAIVQQHGPEYWKALKTSDAELPEEDKQMIRDLLSNAKYRQVQSPVAVKHGSEAIIQCNSYYAIHRSAMKTLPYGINTAEGSFMYYLLQNIGISPE